MASKLNKMATDASEATAKLQTATENFKAVSKEVGGAAEGMSTETLENAFLFCLFPNNQNSNQDSL